MANKRWVLVLVVAVGALAMAASPQAAVSSSRTEPGFRSLVARSSPAGHLYVLDSAGTVTRFPLAQDGLPATTPDGVLTMIGAATGPMGLAVDHSGNMFVADTNDWAGVAKFPAWATGPHKPVSILNLSADGPDWLKIDDEERLYVHLEANPRQGIAVFAKGAHGNDRPISIVPPYRSLGYVIDFVIAPSGALYALNYVGPVAVYYHPLDNPSQPDQFMWPLGLGNWEGIFDSTLALDRLTNKLYIQFDSGRGNYNWNVANYGARPLPGHIAAPDRLIFTGQCGSVNYGAAVISTVISQKYLLMSCGWTDDVLVYRSDRFGRQHPLEAVGQGYFQSINEIALGP